MLARARTPAPSTNQRGRLRERIVAPAAVLTLHAFLVADVVLHREFLHSGTITALGWSTTVLSVVAYLCTVMRDPGFLQPSREVSRTMPATVLGAQNSTSGDVREICVEVPIGHALDAEEDDPGEETIELVDIERAARHRESERVQSGQQMRFCKVCQLYQPLRTKHCRDCDRCIRTHDHHCPWIGTCVGEGNRVYFFWFLVVQLIELVFFFLDGVYALHLEAKGFAFRLVHSPLLILGLIIIVFLMVMVSCLLVFHLYLMVLNLTTWESISWHKISYLQGIDGDKSPFSRSCSANIAAYCCLPWCPCKCAQQLARNGDGWIVWDLSEPHTPLDCSRKCPW